MALEISSILLARLLTETQNSPEREVCGLLFGAADLISAIEPCRNVASDPRTAFEIDPVALIAAHRNARSGGAAILGCYHSHPTGSTLPSARDAAAAPPDGAVWIILAGQDYGVYRAVEDGRIAGRFDPLPHKIVAG